MSPGSAAERGRGPDDRRPGGTPGARKDDSRAGAGLESYRGFVSVLVRRGFPHHLSARIEPDDIVQDVLLKVWGADPNFGARDEGERLAFLRRACASTLSDAVRRFDRGKRRVALDRSLDDSSARLEEWLAAIQSSPSQRASKHEQLLRLAQAIADLPENQRRAVELRHLKRHSLTEVADVLKTTTPAVAGLLRRALGTLRDRLGGRADDR